VAEHDDAADIELELRRAGHDGATHADEDATDPGGGRDGDDESDTGGPQPPPRQHLWLTLTAALLIITAVSGLAGWLGWRARESRQRVEAHELLLQAARQGALNLTTISYTQVETDIKRILDSATGAFREDFQKRSGPFIEVVKQAQSKSQGTVTQAGLESIDGDSAQALVAVAVTTTSGGASDPQPRAWRMRISVQKIADSVKVSNVEFVP
jgi:Mce-associated membrane protein